MSKKVVPVDFSAENLLTDENTNIVLTNETNVEDDDPSKRLTDIISKIEIFKENRRQKITQRSNIVWNTGLTVLVIGFFLNIIFLALCRLEYFPTGLRIVLGILSVVFLFFSMAGVVTLSTVDPTLMDFDVVVNAKSARSKIIRYGTFIIFALDSLSWYGFCGIPCLCFLAWCFVFLIPNKLSCGFKYSHKFIGTMIMDETVSFVSFTYNAYETATLGSFAGRIIPGVEIPGFGDSYPKGGIFLWPFVAIAVLSLCEAGFMVCYTIYHLLSRTKGSTKRMSSTSVMYVTWYLYLNRYGISIIMRAAISVYFANNPPTKDGIYDAGASEPLYDAVSIAIGILTLIPPVGLALLGPKNVFNITAQQFDRDKANQKDDGRFVAELLASFQIFPGDTFWIHWDKCERLTRNDYTDHRQNWYEGKVKDVENDRFRVEIIDKAEDPSIIRPMLIWIEQSGGDAGAVQTQHKVNDVEVGTQSDPMLDLAVRNFRCIDWNKITLELFTISVRDKSAEKLYDLSRPLHPNESVTYFISHAWDDSGEVKFAALKEVAESYKILNKRYPTFWFDKVCFDQDNLSDGLKVLPINVMMCDKVLVLCGAKYAGRLWCIWELFTLFSFADMKEALRRVQICPLATDVDLIKHLLSFDVVNAHCYDPNEESKIRRVIAATGGATGVTQFNNKIRELGQQLSKAITYSKATISVK